ncbi:MAG: substrate-binding domain-containing protein [Rhodobacteraceae bacterium]|nr:substrate-binding domain-containing protein [Paracoccaceae bacterium]
MRKKYADIIDVAIAAGVSAATVSRSFNHPDKVRADTKKRINQAVERTGYIRNRAAQAIHGKRSGMIGLIVPTLDNAIFANLIQAFTSTLAEHGFTMLVTTHGYDLKSEYQLLRSLLSHRVEGIALIGLEHNAETYDLLELRETPCVAIWNYNQLSRIHCVGSDNFEAGQQIADHILSKGHKNIGTIFPQLAGNDRAAARFAGVISKIEEAGLKIPNELRSQSIYSIKHARICCRALLQRDTPPTALICGNDVIAQGSIYEAQALGMKIPQDVAVAGIGDFSGSGEIYPSLTTVRLRANKIGIEAAQLLVGVINGENTQSLTRIAVDLELQERESTNFQINAENA